MSYVIEYAIKVQWNEEMITLTCSYVQNIDVGNMDALHFIIASTLKQDKHYHYTQSSYTPSI